METTAIQFFTGVISCHSVNQLFFAKVLCDVIRQQGASRSGQLPFVIMMYSSCKDLGT